MHLNIGVSSIFPGRQMPARKMKELQGESPAAATGEVCVASWRKPPTWPAVGGAPAELPGGALDLTPSNKLN